MPVIHQPAGSPQGGQFAPANAQQSQQQQKPAAKKPPQPAKKPDAHQQHLAHLAHLQQQSKKPTSKPDVKQPDAHQQHVAHVDQQLHQEADSDLQQAAELDQEAASLRSQISSLQQKLSSLYRIANSGTSTSGSSSSGSSSGSSTSGSTAASTTASGSTASTSGSTSSGTTSSSSPSSSSSTTSTANAANQQAIASTQSQISSLQSQLTTVAAQAASLRAQAAQAIQQASGKGENVTAILEKAATLTGAGELTYVSFPIEKVETNADGDLEVYGKATDGSVDSDEQIVDPDFSAKAIQNWLSTGGNVRVQHNPQRDPAGVGMTAEAGPDGSQWVKSLIIEPVAKRLVSKGALRAYSVGIAKPVIVRDSVARGGRITGGQIVEISLVDRPANKNCGIQLVKSDSHGDPEYVGKVFGSEDVVAKAAGMSIAEIHEAFDEIVKTVTIELPEDVQIAFTPNDLDKIIRHRNIGKRDFDQNVGGGVDRDTIPDEDFAGKDRSFPIVTPGDVSDAASSVGRAGPSNHDPDQLKENIKRIAHRKGDTFVAQLPDAWKYEGIEKAGKVPCSKCSKKIKAGSAFCPGCGTKQSAAKTEKMSGVSPTAYHRDPDENLKCLSCSKYNDTDAKFCDQCGATVTPAMFKNDSGDDDGKQDCGLCKGTGKIREGHVTCPRCHGDGKIASGEPDEHDEVSKADSGDDDGPDCALCKGTGKIREGHVTCPKCHGSGKMSDAEKAEVRKAEQKAQRAAEKAAIREALTAGLLKDDSGQSAEESEEEEDSDDAGPKHSGDGMDEGLNVKSKKKKPSGDDDDDDDDDDYGDSEDGEEDDDSGSTDDSGGADEEDDDDDDSDNDDDDDSKDDRKASKGIRGGKIKPGGPKAGKKKKPKEFPPVKSMMPEGTPKVDGPAVDPSGKPSSIRSKSAAGAVNKDWTAWNQERAGQEHQAAAQDIQEQRQGQQLTAAQQDTEHQSHLRHEAHVAHEEHETALRTRANARSSGPKPKAKPKKSAPPSQMRATSGPAPTGKSSAEPDEVKTAKWQRALGVSASQGALHDLTCPAYHPDIAAKSHPHYTLADLIDPSEWQRIAMDKAASAPLPQAILANQLFEAAVELKSADPLEIYDLRLEANKAYSDGAPGPGQGLSPAEPRPPAYRGYLTTGHAAPSPGQAGPNTSPLISGQISAAQFQRDYIDAGHASESPSNHSVMAPLQSESFAGAKTNPDVSSMKAGTADLTTQAPGHTGSSGRRFYTNAHRDNTKHAMKVLHDHIAETFPDLCPMGGHLVAAEPNEPPAVKMIEPELEAPVMTPIREVNIDKLLKRLEKLVYKGELSLEDARNEILKTQEPQQTDAPVVSKAATAGNAGVSADIIKAAVAEALEAAAAETNATMATMMNEIKRLKKTVNKMADYPDPSVNAWKGVAMMAPPQYQTSAAPAGMPTMSEVAERTQLMMMRELEDQFRHSSDPAQREAAWTTICKMRGLV